MCLILNNKKSDLLVIFFFPLLFSFVINFIFSVNLHHDSLLMYLNFKFLYNYYQTYGIFPQWVDYIYSGLDASALYLYDVSKIFFPSIIIGKFLNINSYVIYLINLCLLNSIFLYGVYKNINEHKYKNYIIIIISSIFLSFTFLHKSFSANFEIFVLFPYIFFYAKKFINNRKISEINKILLIILLGYLNSLQYFSIFFVYFVGIFLLIFFTVNFKYSKNIKLKPKHILFFVTWLIVSSIYFLYVENVIQKNYFLPNREIDLAVNNSFSFALHGYHNILIKFLTATSNFFWWDVPLTISLTGIFFNCIFFFSKKNKENNKFRFSLLIFISFIILISETFIFYDLVKIFYHFPFLGFFRHFSFIIIYLKPLLIITAIYGLITYFNLIQNKDFAYLLKFKLKFVFILCLLFFLSYISINFLNYQLNLIISGQFEDVFLKEFFSTFKDKLFYLGLNERLDAIDLFRGLKTQIFYSFLINLTSLIFLFILILYFIKIGRINYLLITLIIILNLLPGFFYNYSQYSMNSRINLFSQDNILINKLHKSYKKIIISDTNFYENNSIKVCQSSQEIIDLENISKIIPKFSIFYENIYLFLRIKNCSPRLRADFLSKNYQNILKNYLHFEKSTEYEKINNEYFIIYNPKKKINSNINYSENWVAESEQKQHNILNHNGKIKIEINSHDNISKIFLKYKNRSLKFNLIANLFLGFVFYLIFFLNLRNTFFLKNKLKRIKLKN